MVAQLSDHVLVSVVQLKVEGPAQSCERLLQQISKMKQSKIPSVPHAHVRYKIEADLLEEAGALLFFERVYFLVEEVVELRREAEVGQQVTLAQHHRQSFDDERQKASVALLKKAARCFSCTCTMQVEIAEKYNKAGKVTWSTL